MRKITEKSLRAFRNRENFSLSNTQVRRNTINDRMELWLFGNLIAYTDAFGEVYGSLAGWNTPTTRERLNGLGFKFHQKDFCPYLNGQPCESRKWYRLSNFSEVE